MPVSDSGLSTAETPLASPGRLRHSRWLVRVLGASGVLIVVAVIVCAVLAGTYQPLGVDGEATGPVGGMPPFAASLTNTFGSEPGQYYVAPRTTPFTIEGTVTNTGPEPVTIIGATIINPAAPGGSLLAWPLTMAGQAEWYNPENDPAQLPAGCELKACPLSGLRLQPGVGVTIALPVRFVSSCYDPNGWTGADRFYVRERFGPFTHWVAIAYSPPYIFHEPGVPNLRITGLTCPR
jgi:hypothetical protein